MDDDLEIAGAFFHLIFSGVVTYLILKKRRRQPRWWVRPWWREDQGILDVAHNQMRFIDPGSFRSIFRLSPAAFDILLEKVEDRIKKKDTKLRRARSPRQRLSATLEYLASGSSMTSCQWGTRIPKQSLSKFMPEVLEAIRDILGPQYLKAPEIEEEWLSFAKDFQDHWQFPNCLGAIDGKHVTFYPRKEDGSFFRNYKSTDSIVLLAAVDARKKFTLIDVGCNGRVSDGGVFARSNMGKRIVNDDLNFPQWTPLPERVHNMPHVFVADAAFSLNTRVMKPFRHSGGLTREQKTFNYRLSRARHVVEAAFGILSSRFRILRNPMSLDVDKVQLITEVCCILHNFLMDYQPVTENEVVEPWLTEPLPGSDGRRSRELYHRIRNEFIEYFCTNGAVPWQDRLVANFRF